jgi:hypothetical protein
MAQQVREQMPIPVLIGRNVARVRESRGWNRTHLSHVAFMDRTTITIIETGYDGDKLNNPGPTTFIVTYEVESTTGPGLPEKPAKITYYASNGFLKTISVKIGGYWSLNVEIPDGGSVQLHVQEDVFTSVDCDIDAAGLLNPIKGKTDLNGNGWTCDVPSHTLSSG